MVNKELLISFAGRYIYILQKLIVETCGLQRERERERERIRTIHQTLDTFSLYT